MPARERRADDSASVNDRASWSFGAIVRVVA
jgi:hypothetical protein